jgi:penicillin amidase/acyl-homoserine-lactone acylase
MLNKIPWREILLGLTLIIVVALIYIFWPESADVSALKEAGASYDVNILRDTWGVPHIFGKTDADAAFGLAYAHAEDDFLTIQQTLLAARGNLATVYGQGSAPIDYSVQLLHIWPVVNDQYPKLEPQTRALVEAYAEGLNRYAYQHPDAILSSELFPITGKDIIAASVQKSPLFFGLDNTLGQYGLCEDSTQARVESPNYAYGWADRGVNIADTRFGSNVFAVGPSRTSDGSVYLGVNSHQPWTGPAAWYEAHVHSEEGWDMVGATFPATPVIIHGHNRTLGWAFTVSHPDLIDVYELETDAAHPNQYRYNGEWKDFDITQAPLTVKIVGRLKVTVNRPVYWSVQGPVMCKDGKFFAIRYAGFGRADIFEQLYHMNKAANFDEWKAAVKTLALPTFNVGYADQDGNIFYLYNGDLPVKAEGYDWTEPVPGNTSATLWTDYLPFEKLPQVFNPPSGFIQNSNSTPFQTTIGEGNPDPANFSPTLNIETYLTNRAMRSLDLFGNDESITWDEFVSYKYDLAYSPQSGVAQIVNQIINTAGFATPDLAIGADVLRQWDLRTDPDNKGAALAVLTLYFVSKADPDFSASQLTGVEPVGQQVVMDSFAKAVDVLKNNFGRLDPAWGEVNRLQRGTVDLGLGGGPDILHAVYGELQENGRLKGTAGDSYVLLVHWKPDGSLESFSVHQFGSATLDQSSPHYADQALLFVKRELKPVWFEEAQIRANLEREYQP